MKKFEFENNRKYAEYVEGQTNIVLDKCGIYGYAEDRNGLMENIEMSIEAKSWLFDIFKNSPYHNGKGQLIIPMEIERPLDRDEISYFASYVENIANKYLLKESVIDGYTYRCVENEIDEIYRYIAAVNYMNVYDDDVILKGKPFSEYREQYQKLVTIRHKFEVDTYRRNGKYVDREVCDLYDKACLISITIRNCVGRTLENEDDISNLSDAFPHSQCREGAKITRVIQKCLKELGLYQLAMENEKETFNKEYAKWCDAVSPHTITKWSVLSINFVDYITMCHGNSWTSCLNTDKHRNFTSGHFSDGFNSRRVLDYALDSTTMVFYTIDENYNGDDWELQPKNTRQLFHFGQGKLVQARLYPKGNRELYTQYRENVESLLAEGMGEANLWSAPERGMIDYDGYVVNTPYDYSENGDFIDFLSNACHASWELNDFEDEINYVVFRGSTNREDNGIPMIVGSTDAVCIMCGNSLRESYHDCIACSSCY